MPKYQPGERRARSMIDAREAYSAWLLHAVTVVLILLGIAIPTTTAQAQKSYEFTAIAFLGDAAPGGGTADTFGAWNASLNENGDASVAFQLSPFLFPEVPLGTNTGIYRFDADSSTVSAVMTPGVTPAPGGGF